MMISTRGRYALRVLVDLAEHGGGLVPMKDVAARQGISKKYMEQIMALLVRDGYVEGVHGKAAATGSADRRSSALSAISCALRRAASRRWRVSPAMSRASARTAAAPSACGADSKR